MKLRGRIYKYAVATRLSHWLWVLALGALVSSGLQIFNATSLKLFTGKLREIADSGYGGYWEDQGYEWYARI